MNTTTDPREQARLRVVALRERHGISISQLVERTKASRRQVFRWLAGDAQPNTRALRDNIDELYAEVLGLVGQVS